MSTAGNDWWLSVAHSIKKKKKYTNWKWWWFYKWIVHVLINKREIRVASVCWAQNTNKRSRKKKTTTANDRLHAAIRQPNRVDKHSIVYCSGLWWSCLLYILFFDWHNSQCECNIDFDLRISIADVAVTTEQAQLRISWGQSHSISIVVAHFNCKKKKNVIETVIKDSSMARVLRNLVLTL